MLEMLMQNGIALDNLNWVWGKTDDLYKLKHIGQSGIFSSLTRVYVGIVGVFTPSVTAKDSFILK